MSGTTLDTIPRSFLYRMDNVYLKFTVPAEEYDPWKQEVSVNLISSNSIFETEGNYVLAEKGYKVIKCDSSIYYNKKNCSEELNQKT